MLKVIAVPAPVTLRLLEDSNGKFAKEIVYPFAEWIREACFAPQGSPLQTADKADIAVELLQKIRAAKRTEAKEIVLESEHYSIVVEAVSAFKMMPEASVAVTEGGYRKALANPTERKAE